MTPKYWGTERQLIDSIGEIQEDVLRLGCNVKVSACINPFKDDGSWTIRIEKDGRFEYTHFGDSLEEAAMNADRFSCFFTHLFCIG